MADPTYVTSNNGSLAGGASRTYTLPAASDEDLILMFLAHRDFFFANIHVTQWGGVKAPEQVMGQVATPAQTYVSSIQTRFKTGDPGTIDVFNSRSAGGDMAAALVYRDLKTSLWTNQNSTEGPVSDNGATDSGDQHFPSLAHSLGGGAHMYLPLLIVENANHITLSSVPAAWTLRQTINSGGTWEVRIYEAFLSGSGNFPAEQFHWASNGAGGGFNYINSFRLIPAYLQQATLP